MLGWVWDMSPYCDNNLFWRLRLADPVLIVRPGFMDDVLREDFCLVETKVNTRR